MEYTEILCGYKFQIGYHNIEKLIYFSHFCFRIDKKYVKYAKYIISLEPCLCVKGNKSLAIMQK